MSTQTPTEPSKAIPDLEASPANGSPPPIHPHVGGYDEKEAFLVRFEPDDPRNPRNFRRTHKIWIAFQMSLLTTAGTLGAAIMTPASPQIAEYVGVSTEATSLVVALYMLGSSSRFIPSLS